MAIFGHLGTARNNETELKALIRGWRNVEKEGPRR